MFKFLYDARRFILKNRHIADIAPLQLYCSGLIFAPTGSIVRKTFGTQIPKWISKLPKVRETWDAELENLEFHSRANSIAFSADGKWLASGGFFDPIRIWDLATGTVHQTFEDYDWTYSISFSPNRELLVSGSSRGVKVWDLATGSLHKTLEGHDDLVKSVAISPDGQWLASGSDDRTIGVWDLVTGSLHKTLEGHDDLVRSVAISPDGKWLVSGSIGANIKVWDLTIGTLHQALEVQYEWPNSVSFSLDGPYLQINLGASIVKSLDDSDRPIQTPPKIELCIRGGEWVSLQGRKVLWLPKNHRPLCTAIRNGMLAMGHESGHISLLEFCL